MKIEVFNKRMGRRLITGANANNRNSLGDAIREAIVGGVKDHVQNVSPGMLRKLMKSIRLRGEGEAMRLFGMAANIMATVKSGKGDNNATMAFDGQRLAAGSTGGDRTLGNSRFKQGGSVYWQNLSDSWQEHKYGYNKRNARRFFMHTGSLRSYIQRNSSIYVNRLGGVRADMLAARQARGPRQNMSMKWIMGEVTVSIFPSIGMGLMPMMSSGRWTSHNNGEFERRFFSGQMAEKLIGPEGRHRALILPLVQFWIAFRIPRAIQEAVKTWSKGPRGGNPT